MKNLFISLAVLSALSIIAITPISIITDHTNAISPIHSNALSIFNDYKLLIVYMSGCLLFRGLFKISKASVKFKWLSILIIGGSWVSLLALLAIVCKYAWVCIKDDYNYDKKRRHKRTVKAARVIILPQPDIKM